MKAFQSMKGAFRLEGRATAEQRNMLCLISKTSLLIDLLIVRVRGSSGSFRTWICGERGRTGARLLPLPRFCRSLNRAGRAVASPVSVQVAPFPRRNCVVGCKALGGRRPIGICTAADQVRANGGKLWPDRACHAIQPPALWPGFVKRVVKKPESGFTRTRPASEIALGYESSIIRLARVGSYVEFLRPERARFEVVRRKKRTPRRWNE